MSEITSEEHEAYMRRAIELGALGGLKERTGGKALRFLVQLATFLQLF
jgi:hypothetical protein